MANSYSELGSSLMNVETFRNSSAGTVSKLVTDLKVIEADRRENIVSKTLLRSYCRGFLFET